MSKDALEQVARQLAEGAGNEKVSALIQRLLERWELLPLEDVRGLLKLHGLTLTHNAATGEWEVRK